MSDLIKVGLDFGTHQTKICVQRTPDEGHGEPIYEFFQFKDLKGRKSYFLPSVIQINEDDTLSYGYVNPEREKHTIPLPQKEEVIFNDFSPEEEAKILLNKYLCARDSEMNISSLVKMLKIKQQKDLNAYQAQCANAEKTYREKLKEYRNKRYIYRYFKQAAFAERPWEKDLDSILLSIWYLAYVIFKLEEVFGTNFATNMGIPADDIMFEKKRTLAVSVLASAYRLVEDVYHNNLEEYLNETIENLKSKTVIVPYNPSLKEDYNINIFPEAYASLITLTTKGKLTPGMSLTVDIGGGTTDISFFIIKHNDKFPDIYKYWSIQRGLNYIAEESGFDYSEGNFNLNCENEVVEKFNNKKMEIVGNLIKKLISRLSTETKIPKEFLLSRLIDRTVVYAGGGSIYTNLSTPVSYFTEIHRINSNMWKEERITDKSAVIDACYLLTVAYGLSLAEKESDVKLCSLESIFTHLSGNKEDFGDKFIDKDAV